MSEEAFSLDWTEEERALWDAGREELPEFGAETRLLASLGLPSPDPGGGEPKSGRVTRPETGLVAPKALVPIVLALGLGALGGALYLVNRPGENLSARSLEKSKTALGDVPALATASPSLRVGSKTTAEGEPEKTVAPAPLPKATPIASDALKNGAAPISLGEELAMIKRARSLLASGDVQGAEASLDEYRKKVIAPRLGAEALFVRIEVLVAAGKRAQALELAKPLRAADSPYRSRVEVLLGSP